MNARAAHSPYSRIDARVSGFWRPHYDLTLDGAPLTRLTELHAPLSTSFALDGATWSIGGHFGRTGLDAVFSIVRGGLLARGRFELRDPTGQAVALAAQRGFFDAGYDVDLAGTAGRLDSDKKVSHFLWQGAGGAGRIDRQPGGLIAQLPATLEMPLQVFLVVLALGRWARLASNG
ncbi:MAG TPA: hypothetical protein VEA16_03405 [Vicinamibacterales bacterium]|nr:hypothetical protein [Vicinamibacterales bacterium]